MDYTTRYRSSTSRLRQRREDRVKGSTMSLRNGLRRDTSTLLFSIFIIVCCAARTASAQGTAIPITEADIQQIVGDHNFFRSTVDPQPSNMRRIVWNSELASVAQSYAETCMFGPNPDRAEQAASFDTVGENRAFGPTNNYTQLIERGWFIQRSNFDFDTNMCLSPGACDEYTQLVWAATDMVGCGAANCPTVTGLPILRDAVVFVCNYGPEGNIPEQAPYAAGEVCSQCPDGMNQCVENLCTASTTATPPTTTEPATPTTTSEQPETTTQTVATTTEASTTTSEPSTTTTAVTTTTEQPPPVSSSPSTPPPCPTVKPTKNPLTVWKIIWLIIKTKQKPYIVTKPDRSRTRSKSSRSKSSKSGSSSDSSSEKSSKSKSSKTKSSHSRKKTHSKSSKTRRTRHRHHSFRHTRAHRRRG